MILHSYNRGEGIKALRAELEARGEHTVVLDRKPMRRRPMVVCWGSKPIVYPRDGCVFLNPPEVTKVFSNKLLFFRHIEKIFENDPYPVPEWTTDPEVAKRFPIAVVRHVIDGSGGEGIELIPQGQEMPKAPLYTRYQKKTSEYRAHVFKVPDGFVIRHIQKKTAKADTVNPNFKIRNAENGFVFQQNGFDTPKAVYDLSLSFMKDYFPEIDFVALDVIFSKKEDRAWVLEGNTAPGLQGKTVQVYADYLLERKRMR